MGARDILRILDRTAVLVGRLALVALGVAYHRQRALSAFDRELRRQRLPDPVRRVLLERYRTMLPLNPLAYAKPKARQRTRAARERTEAQGVSVTGKQRHRTLVGNAARQPLP